MQELVRISAHAIRRYIERVDPSADRRMAVEALHEIRLSGRARSRPRWWTSRRGERPGTRYVYSACHPGVCLVVRLPGDRHVAGRLPRVAPRRASRP